MKKFSNNRVVTIKDLEKSGIYEQALLQDLNKGDFRKLLDLPIETRADIDYMEPILFAVKNELNTFRVYKYYTENLQDNVKLASEIVATEPNLIEGTPISRNKQFFKDNIEVNPQIIKYMSPALKLDTNFIQELSNINNPEIRQEIRQEIAKNCEIAIAIASNPELSNDKEFMSTAIDKDVKFLEYASDELRNDKEFLKEKSSQNEKVIDYVVDNIQKFGLEGIKGVRESSRDFTIEDCITLIDEMAENSQDERYAKVKAKIQERGLDDVHTVRWVTAMAAQTDDINPKLVKKVLNYSMLTMEKTKQDLTETGEMQINLDNMQELITPLILNRLKEKLQLQGINIEEELQQKLDNYQEFYDKYHAQFKEQKKQANKAKIDLTDINQTTENVKISDIRFETQEIKKAVANENKDIDIDTQELE